MLMGMKEGTRQGKAKYKPIKVQFYRTEFFKVINLLAKTL